MWRVGRVVAVILVSAVFSSCVNPFGTNAKELAAGSSSALLVPSDPRFSEFWQFTIEETADNYTFRSNWDPQFNPDIDKNLMVVGFQINNVETWTGRADADNEALTAAMKGLPADVEMASGSDACEPYTDNPVVVQCSYDLGDFGQLKVLVRKVNNGSRSTLIVVYADKGAADDDFVTGEFIAVPIEEATELWLANS